MVHETYLLGGRKILEAGEVETKLQVNFSGCFVTKLLIGPEIGKGPIKSNVSYNQLTERLRTE